MKPLLPIMKTYHIGNDVALKLDIEGMEYEVLESWNEELWTKVSLLLLEVHLLQKEDTLRWESLRISLQARFSQRKEQISPYDPRIKIVCFER